MYVDYKYYWEEYGGRMPEESFPAAAHRAEAYIRYLTSYNGDIFADSNDMVKDAVCAAADVYYADSAAREKQTEAGRKGTVKSENNDGYSVSYVTEQTDGQIREELLRHKAYEAVYTYLCPGGWLYRGVRCGHGHKCGYHDL